MGRKSVLIGLLVFLLAVIFVMPGYCDDPTQKLGRGIANMLTFPVEMLLQTSRVNNTDGPVAGATWGVLKGLSMTVVRLAVGVYEVLTFPVPMPAGYEPILNDPEFVFEESNW